MRYSMKMFLVLLISMLFSIGCSFVTTSAPTTETVNGDVWYVKNKTLLGLIVAADVYYCPAPSMGNASCQQATIIDNTVAGAAPQGDMNAGFGAQPQPQQQPQQPQYVAPAQQQQPQYVAPAQQQQPPYGTPAAPASPAPATPATNPSYSQ